MNLFEHIDMDDETVRDEVDAKGRAGKIYDFLTIQCIICILLVIFYLIANIVRTQWAAGIKNECNRLIEQEETTVQCIVDFSSKAYETITKSKPLKPTEAMGGDLFCTPVEENIASAGLIYNSGEENKQDEDIKDEKGEVKEKKKEPDDAVQVLKSQEIGLISPMSGVITSKFGQRKDPFSVADGFHYGVDIESKIGSVISSTAKGKVITAQQNELAGKFIEIDHGNGIISRYLHCNKLLVKEGDNVQRGQAIAELGNTGRSTGPHLHFELRYDGTPFDPLTVVKIND